MNIMKILLLGAAVLAISGCSVTTIGNAPPVRDAPDAKKASQLNSELGLNYMVQGKNEMAMEKLLKAIEYDASSVDAHHYLAELYRRLERPDKAKVHYSRAHSLAPKDPAIQNNFGVFLCSEKQYDEGLKYLLKALENPAWSGRKNAFENIGQCYFDKGDIARAEEYYREALKQDSQQPKSLLAMADISLQEKNYITARAFLQRYSSVARHTAQSLWLGIQIERQLGDHNALSSYEMLLRNNFPNAEETRIYLESK